MISLVNVSKEFEFRPVLDHIELQLERGRVYSLSAPNGSGKTTLLMIMAGLSKPSEGCVLWQGKSWTRQTRREIGVVLQDTFLYADMTGRENLEFYSALYGVDHPRHTAEHWLEVSDLKDAGNSPVKEYSKGMKQRLSLARALLHRPQLLLLDEPFDGLDKTSSCTFQEILAQHVQMGAALFTVTHDPLAARQADTRFALSYGRLVRM